MMRIDSSMVQHALNARTPRLSTCQVGHAHRRMSVPPSKMRRRRPFSILRGSSAQAHKMQAPSRTQAEHKTRSCYSTICFAHESGTQTVTGSATMK